MSSSWFLDFVQKLIRYESLRILKKKIAVILEIFLSTFKKWQMCRKEQNPKWTRNEIFYFIFLKREMSYIMQSYINIEEKEVEVLNIGNFL